MRFLMLRDGVMNPRAGCFRLEELTCPNHYAYRHDEICLSPLVHNARELKLELFCVRKLIATHTASSSTSCNNMGQTPLTVLLSQIHAEDTSGGQWAGPSCRQRNVVSNGSNAYMQNVAKTDTAHDFAHVLKWTASNSSHG